MNVTHNNTHLVLCRGELVLAGAGGEVLDRRGDGPQTLGMRVLDNGGDQATTRAHSHADVYGVVSGQGAGRRVGKG